MQQNLYKVLEMVRKAKEVSPTGHLTYTTGPQTEITFHCEANHATFGLLYFAFK
jgi:hypothetical protein